ncbi:MAG TPA: hypothetical protein PKY77_08895 [Phycisphaerae bacterium]|nr:hypothetical protein [Phycisphaerae bacterium]HRY67291.1 hypothetical protein [Phycisphaerae bacterium]HSA26339.1 hypothetical protein [Phycisphaerae bacterium]
MVDWIVAALTATRSSQIIVWGLILMGAVVVLFGGLWYYRRRWLQADDKAEADRTPWTLDDLRQMRESGQINEVEYQTLRETMIAALRGGRPDSGASEGGSSDPSRR